MHPGHVRPAHSKNWFFFTLDIRICCTVHGKCIPSYINLKEMSSIGPGPSTRMRNSHQPECSGHGTSSWYTGIYQYRNYTFCTTWYIPVHTSMTCSYSYILVYPVLYQYSCFHPGGGHGNSRSCIWNPDTMISRHIPSYNAIWLYMLVYGDIWRVHKHNATINFSYSGIIFRCLNMPAYTTHENYMLCWIQKLKKHSSN